MTQYSKQKSGQRSPPQHIRSSSPGLAGGDVIEPLGKPPDSPIPSILRDPRFQQVGSSLRPSSARKPTPPKNSKLTNSAPNRTSPDRPKYPLSTPNISPHQQTDSNLRMPGTSPGEPQRNTRSGVCNSKNQAPAPAAWNILWSGSCRRSGCPRGGGSGRHCRRRRRRAR